MTNRTGTRGVSPVIGVVLLFGITVALSVVLGVGILSTDFFQTTTQPSVVIGSSLNENGTGNDTLDITHRSGDTIDSGRILVVASKPVDIGGKCSPHPDPTYKTVGEKLTEGTNQACVGSEWTAGETFQIGAAGDLEGVTVRVVWNPTEIDKDDAGGDNPSNLVGTQSQVLYKTIIGE